MSRSRFWSVALGLLLLAVSAAQARGSGDGESNRAKKAATPDQAVEQLARAAAGDLDAFMAVLDKPSRDAMKARLASADALLAFLDALDKKFGKDDKPKPPPFKAILKGLEKIEIIKKDSEADDRMVLTVRMTGRGPDGTPRTGGGKLTALKEGDAWTLRIWDVLPGPGGRRPREVELTAAESRKQQELFAKRVGVITNMTRQLEDGKFKSRQEALEGLRAALRKAFAPPKEGADEPSR